jgi:hypothetical protein
LRKLANILGDQGKLDEAASMIKEVLEKRKRIHGEEDPATIMAMTNLATSLVHPGDLASAMEATTPNTF